MFCHDIFTTATGKKKEHPKLGHSPKEHLGLEVGTDFGYEQNQKI